MHISREIPYRKIPETLREEKRINTYIKTDPLRLEINLHEKLFNVFLKAIPKDKQEKYRKEGIPYGEGGIYTLKIKK